ncbi:MAG TPA: hypothetical protein VG265_03785 [Gaiellaceae bacterium]|nr:hypothetical protein [Gaiellaceae bacterium]
MITSVLAAALVVTLGADVVVGVGIDAPDAHRAVVVVVAATFAVVSLCGGPTGVTVFVPAVPTVVIALDADVVFAAAVVEAATAVVSGQALEGAGGSAEVDERSPADAAPAIASASRATAASTRRATGPP